MPSGLRPQIVLNVPNQTSLSLRLAGRLFGISRNRANVKSTKTSKFYLRFLADLATVKERLNHIGLWWAGWPISKAAFAFRTDKRQILYLESRRKAAAPETKAGSPLNPPTVVLIDDNHCDAIMLRHALAELGSPAQICHFETRQAALAYMGTHPAPDLLIFDFWLHERTGLEIANEFRADARFRSVPTFLLSGLIPPKDREEAAQIGVTCLEKASSLEGWTDLANHILSSFASA